MNNDTQQLERRVADLERQLERLQTAEEMFALSATGGDLRTGKALNMGEVIVGHTGDGLRKLTVTHDNIDTYPNAAGYLNANRNSPTEGATGAFDVGGWWDANNFVTQIFSRGIIHFGFYVDSSFRYVTEMSFDEVIFNAPIIPPRITTATRDALPGVVDGMIIYNTTLNKFQGRAGAAWVDLH